MIKKLSKAMILGILMFTLAGCSGGYVEDEVVSAKVVAKEHIPKRTTTSIVPTGKTVIPVTTNHPEKFYVTVEYQGLILKIESEAIYNTVNNGESIQVLLVKKFDSEGQEKRRVLREL